MLHYLHKKGHITECFIEIKHVTNTTIVSFKAAINKLFSRYRLSISRFLGQGYDGECNMHASSMV